MKSVLLVSLGIVATGVSGAEGPRSATPRVSVPFTVEQIFGSRPVVAATINGKPFRLVLHANAGSYLQINHAEAANVGARDLKHVGAYGISAPGQVSDLGRDDGFVDRVAIGGWKMENAPVAVFEVPAAGSQGMLGLPFLHGSNAVLDFATRTLVLPGSSPSRTLANDMRKRGYRGHALTRDATDGRYLVTVTINGVAAPMVVSTVATVDLDTAFARRAKVGTGAAAGSYGGPSGATGTVYRSATPVILQIGTWKSKPAVVPIEDTYAYSKAPRPVDERAARGGALGADFMLANGAVIDFGNAVLYLKE